MPADQEFSFLSSFISQDMLFPCHSGNTINLLTTVHLNPLSPSLQLPGCSKGRTYFVCVAQMHKQFQSETLGLSEFLHYGFILLLQVWQHSPCLQPSCHVLTEAINLITENLLTVLHFFQPYSGSASLTQAQ